VRENRQHGSEGGEGESPFRPLFTSVELVQELMAKTRTKTGLEVAVNILDKVYATGRQVTAQVQEQLRVLFDADLPQWNYRITPWNMPREEVI
jgi:hypothetical protein